MQNKYVANAFQHFLTVDLKDGYLDKLKENIHQPISELRLNKISIKQSDQPLPRYLNIVQKYCFPNGLKVIKQDDYLFSQIEDYYVNEEDKYSGLISDLQTFVLTDLKSMQKFYCSAINCYDQISLVAKGKGDQSVNVYVPKAFCIISKIALYSAQKMFLMKILTLSRQKPNKQQKKALDIGKDSKSVHVDESNLTELYIKNLQQICFIDDENAEIEVKINKKEQIFSYYVRNGDYQPMFNIVNPSNNLFDFSIFNQTPYNIYQIQIFLLLQYQMIIVSKRPHLISVFAENLIELLRPLQWKGVFIPYLINNIFDFQNSKIPYIIGLDQNDYDFPEKFRPEIQQRVIYDLDEFKFVAMTEEPKCPQPYQNFLMKQLNSLYAEIKFYEQEYFQQAVLQYRQCFYLFNLLMYHDLLHYFSKTSTGQASAEQIDTAPNTARSRTASFQNIKMRQNSNQINLETQNAEAENQQKIAYFNYKAYVASFDQQDQPFFQVMIQTTALDYKEEYIAASKTKQIDFMYGQVFCYIKDVRFLAVRANKEETLDVKLTQLQNKQNDKLKEIMNKSAFPVQIKYITEGMETLIQNLTQSAPNKTEQNSSTQPEEVHIFKTNTTQQQKLPKSHTEKSESLNAAENDSDEFQQTNQSFHQSQDMWDNASIASSVYQHEDKLYPKNQINALKLFSKRHEFYRRRMEEDQVPVEKDRASTIIEIRSVYSNGGEKELPSSNRKPDRRASMKNLDTQTNQISLSFANQQLLNPSANQNGNNMYSQYGDATSLNSDMIVQPVKK